MMRRTRLVTAAIAALAMALCTAPAMAQDDAFDEDALFGSDEDLIEVVEETSADDAVVSLLVTDQVRIGGSFAGKADFSWRWNDPWSGGLGPMDSYGLSPSLGTTLFFDARPTDGARFLGSVKASWPFETTKTFLTGATYSGTPSPHVTTTADSIKQVNLSIFELFSDFDWNDAAYFRFGKQTVTWGVGYFFSPADVLNLAAIDPESPGAQREGPVTLRANVPLPGGQHNLWAYAVFDSASMKPEDTAVAAKAEFVLGGWELGAGGWYRRDSPLRGMLTAVGSIGDVTLFGEATVSRGSDRSWVTQVAFNLPGFVTMEEDDSSAFFKATAGFMYNDADLDLTLAAQYLYDGEGYADADREARIEEARANETAIKNALTLAGVADTDAAFSGFLKGLIYGSGRHYAAAMLSKSSLFVDELSANLFAMVNLSDFSGYVRPSLSYRPFDGCAVSLGALFVFGSDDSEYIVLNDGPAMAVSLGVTLGSGVF